MKLSEIQKALKAPKDKTNKFGGYAYRNAASILEAVKPYLDGATVTLSDDLVMVGERYYIKATATFKSEKEDVSVTAYARECMEKKGMDEAQITGAASTYARKYALCGLFAIDDSSQDPDETNHGEGDEKPSKAQQTAKAKKIANKGADTVSSARGRLNRAIEAWCKHNGEDPRPWKSGILERRDYEPTAEFYAKAASEFEGYLAQQLADEGASE